ncbi:MAG: hypothetical protein IKJ30_05020 [Bacilli bacterium]|nr:hypothetical protein [Bacilli bacterium]
MKLYKKDILQVSEKIQIILWLLKKCNITSLIKLSILSEILYASKNKIIELNRHNKKYDYLKNLLLYSGITPKKLSDGIIVALDCISILVSSKLIKVVDEKVFDISDICIVDLDYLTNKTEESIKMVSKITDESFFDEVMKYV